MEIQSKIITVNNQEIQVLQYLPIKQKTVFITYVTESSFVDNEDGIKAYDPVERMISTLYCYIKLYTNYEFAEDADLYDVYDQFVSSGDYDLILEVVPDDEIATIEILLDDAIEEKKRELSDLPTIIGKFLDKLILKIPDSRDMQKIIKSMGKELKNISPENMELLKGFMNPNPVNKKSGAK